MITISWTGGGTLEYTDALGSTWTSTGDSDGEYTEAATQSHRFYRVRRLPSVPLPRLNGRAVMSGPFTFTQAFQSALSKKKWLFTLSAPVAVYRNRLRSLADERWTEDTGIYRHGDAAFADFIILASIARQL